VIAVNEQVIANSLGYSAPYKSAQLQWIKIRFKFSWQSRGTSDDCHAMPCHAMQLCQCDSETIITQNYKQVSVISCAQAKAAK